MNIINGNNQLPVQDTSLSLDTQSLYFLTPPANYLHVNGADFSAPDLPSTSNIFNLTSSSEPTAPIAQSEQANVNTSENIIIPVSSTNQNITPLTNTIDSNDIFENVEFKNRLQALKSDLKDLIYLDPRGKEVLTGFYNTKRLHHSKLTHILIDSVVNSTHPDARINSTQFMKWAHDIVTLFPSELFTTWYKASQKPSENSKKKTAGGCLYNAYISKRQEYRKIKLLPRTRRQVIQQPNNLSLLNFDAEPDVIWLKHNNAPWDEVLLRWRRTYTLRERQSDCSIESYFNTFPSLKLANGYILLEEDFKIKYQNYENNFFINWPLIAKRLIQIAEQSLVPEIKDILRQHKNVIESGNVNLLGLFILPFLLNVTKLTGKRGQSSCSRLETQRTLFVHAESLENLHAAISEREKSIQKRKTTNQPFMIFVGSLDGPVQSSIQINNVCYDICTPEKAVDVCFKCYFSLNAAYQEECRNTWTFIEKKVYKMTVTNNDYIDVNKLISSINVLERSAN